MSLQSSPLRRLALVGLTAVAVTSMTLASTIPASAFGPRHHGRFHGDRGAAVGAAVGLGVLGAVAAGAAASQYYNGYPVYPHGAHSGYGYDYYPDHGGYYGPY